MLYEQDDRYRTRRSIAVLISIGAVIATLVFVFLIIGHWIVVPMLWALMEPRIASGIQPSAFEVVTVFVVATAYMLFIAAVAVAAGLSGWVYLHAHDKAQGFIENIKTRFKPPANTT